MMMGFGLLIMLVALAIPILLIAGLVFLLVKPNNQQKMSQPPMVTPGAPSSGVGRACTHCGAGLQPEWTHCPQCGAPTASSPESV